MTPEERNRLAEQWMDAALRRRAEVEARPGLEARVLAHMASASAPARSRLWLPLRTGRYGLVAVAATAILVVVVLHAVWPIIRSNNQQVAHRPVSKSSTTAAVENPSGESITAAGGRSATQSRTPAGQNRISPQDEIARASTNRKPAEVLAAPSRKPRPVAGRQPGAGRGAAETPRLAQFPAPSPLSPQEQLLLRYLGQTPGHELVAVATETRLFQEERLREVEMQSQALPRN